jgi:phage tail sheath protein FI
MPTYKTPDVYVEEISLFPPSVAEVETAIPAFIGYTEKAMKTSIDDLLCIPTKIKSLLDFETCFGKGPAVSFGNVQLDQNNNFIQATFATTYCLYDSMRMFFANGGGDCYVVAVGNYGDTIKDQDTSNPLKGFIPGLKAVKKCDEPTILLFPDAASLSAGTLGGVQQAALAQCGTLGDRVAVLDTGRGDHDGAAFRNNIGISNLKYGAAYAPWLQIVYAKSVSYMDVKNNITKGGNNPVGLGTLTTDTEIQGAINQLDDAIADVSTLNGKVATYLNTAGASSINAKYNALVSTYKNNRTLKHAQDVYTFLYDLARLVDTFVGTTGVKGVALKHQIIDLIGNSLKGAFGDVINTEEDLETVVTTSGYTHQWDVGTIPSSSAWGPIFTGAASKTHSTVAATAASDIAACDSALLAIEKDFGVINGVINGIISGASQYVSTYDSALYTMFPVYKNIILGISDTPTTVPPSGAIAGVYATIDNQRGVFKAPANVSLAGVVGPDYNFDASETDALNVDTNAGKSINAIRAFSGKGTLVWGARTLAGNDNEWRYVNVRRFFNMVEESVKKSTYWAVFEANDANTWVKLRGMIENYLTQKWREGALAGATTKDAFFVKCGLGTTMTSQDILEGRLNVEVGMAVVRPAEFIILKFSHLLQTS